ncbi:GNAT domain-containing protein [Desulfonema limicola]|uniref:GNAT domain-containing protein n=1 Tax=Desulfonema limicola TaxID=45656 RepID=A0A975B915_9BACT|nr:GNAT family N-acetyltransferase [Desulfonema limicola]QTA80979.1 GNAT domain-containing protein [Desulfonema limicola]
MQTPVLNKNYPRQYESWLKLKNGKEVFLRPIMETDGNLIIDLFNKMSPQSIYLRFLRNLDALTENMISHFTHVDYNKEFALAAVVKECGKDAVIAVGRYGYDPDENTTDLAVAVRDDWQNAGLGKPLLMKVVNIAKEHGISHFTGMMDPQNMIIRKVLQELGFKVQYSSKSGFFQVNIGV